MQPGSDGYYRVFTSRPDGTGVVALTQDKTGLPTKHQGSVYWHPSGRYLMFVAQKRDWQSPRLFGSPDYEALPGFGRHNDIWLISADGRHHWQLTKELNTKDQGALLPVFSPDGRHIAWSARQPGGTYVLKVAEFFEHPEPHVENAGDYLPGGRVYYETGSFSSDGNFLFYSSNQDTKSFWQSQIYRLDLANGKSTRLTTGRDYNEHPTVVSTPAGDWVVYMSTRDVDRFRGRLMLGTDFWAMRPDGSQAKRITRMNLNRSDNPQNQGDMRIAGTSAFNPSGDAFLADMQDSLVRQTGLVKLVRLVCKS